MMITPHAAQTRLTKPRDTVFGRSPQRNVRVRLHVAAVFGAALLSGCSILETRPPVAVYAPKPQLSIAAAPSSAEKLQIAVSRPRANLLLNSQRIVVSPQPGLYEVFPGAAWRDPATVAVGDLLLTALQSAGVSGADRSSAGLSANFELATDLRDFQIEVTAQGAQAVLRIHARLITFPGGRIVASRLFEASAPAERDSVEAGVTALNKVLEQTVPEITAWTLSQATQAQ